MDLIKDNKVSPSPSEPIDINQGIISVYNLVSSFRSFSESKALLSQEIQKLQKG